MKYANPIDTCDITWEFFLSPSKESARLHHVDRSSQNTSGAPDDEGCWSTDYPLGLGETEEEAGVFHSEDADKRPADFVY
jgi:hypothetical protein